jgi:hypothetical protein
MPARVSPPETKEFQLEKLDERQGIPTDEKTIVTIRLATVRQNSLRSKLFAEYIRELADNNGGKERVIFRLPLYDLISKEVELTLVGCNITKADGKEPLFRFKSDANGPFLDMRTDQFNDAFGTLDDETAAEIHSKVQEMNPHWIMGGVGDTDLGE